MFTDAAVAAALSPERLSLTVLPTEKCNFRCTYCYEDFAIGRMRAPTIRGLKALIGNRVPHLRHLTLSWFGGEPLLALPVVMDVGAHASSLSRQHGVTFNAGFTTNGYLLTCDLFCRLLEIDHNEFQITLDGDEEWHDQTRIQANRRGTFSVIWKNILSCKRVEGHFAITLRLHVHRGNIESVRRLYKRLHDEVLADSRFRIYFHKISNLNPAERIGESVLGRKEYLDAIDYITDRNSTRDMPGAPISEEHLQSYICYAAKPNSLIIRADGRLGKCTVALHDPRNDVGQLNEDGSLSIFDDKLRPWFEGFRDMSEQALGCPWSMLNTGEASRYQTRNQVNTEENLS